MELSEKLVNDFASAVTAKDARTSEQKETTLYGTVTSRDASTGALGVTLDGSTIETPVVTTQEAEIGDRVTVMIKNRRAVVTGNITQPSLVKVEERYMVLTEDGLVIGKLHPVTKDPDGNYILIGDDSFSFNDDSGNNVAAFKALNNDPTYGNGLMIGKLNPATENPSGNYILIGTDRFSFKDVTGSSMAVLRVLSDATYGNILYLIGADATGCEASATVDNVDYQAETFAVAKSANRGAGVRFEKNGSTRSAVLANDTGVYVTVPSGGFMYTNGEQTLTAGNVVYEGQVIMHGGLAANRSGNFSTTVTLDSALGIKILGITSVNAKLNDDSAANLNIKRFGIDQVTGGARLWAVVSNGTSSVQSVKVTITYFAIRTNSNHVDTIDVNLPDVPIED